MIFAPGKSVADFQVDSIREPFALQCGVSTAAMMLESEPLDGCPSWDLSQELHVALVQQNVHAFGRLFCSILRVEPDHARGVRPDMASTASGAKMMLEAWSHTSQTSTSWR